MKRLLLVFCVVSSLAQAQDCERVWLKGKVTDTLRPAKFLNLMVVNKTTGKGVFGQADGSFGVYVSPKDSIILSVKGYEKIGFRIQPDSLCQYAAFFDLSEKSIEIQEVVVKPLKTIQEIKEERATLAMRDTRTITGVEAFQSPITALYERFSDKAQSKQRVEELKYQDRQVEILQDLLKLYVSYDVIALSREEFEDFIRFMAIDEHFLKTATDVELVAFIKAKFEHYTLLKQDLK